MHRDLKFLLETMFRGNLTTPLSLVTKSCPVCGIEFALPRAISMYRRQNREPIYCPSGHSSTHAETIAGLLETIYEHVTTESKAIKRLRKQLGQEIHRREQAEARADRRDPPPSP